MSIWNMEDHDYVNEDTNQFALDIDELESQYMDFENEETVTICGMLYGQGYALKEVDPIAFRCGFLDWLDANGWRETSEYTADELAAKWDARPAY